MVFIDSGGWFAMVVEWDANHDAARQWHRQNRERLITSDYVIDETLTLFRSRGEYNRGIAFAQRLFAGEFAQIHFLTPAQFKAAWDVFRGFADKDWSFTDCTSRVLIEQLRIERAFSFDAHFRQFGTVTVVP